MTKDEVMKTERKKPEHETDTSLVYNGKYRQMLTYITYQFKDGKLYRAGVLYPEKLDSDSMYIENYEALKEDIIKAYGPPALDDETLLNPGAVIDPDKKAEAVCGGDLMIAAQWEVPGSTVVLMMRGDGQNNCRMSLIYASDTAVHPPSDQDGSRDTGAAE